MKLPHKCADEAAFFPFPLQPGAEGFHGQEKVYSDLGEEMLDHAFQGGISSEAEELFYCSLSIPFLFFSQATTCASSHTARRARASRTP